MTLTPKIHRLSLARVDLAGQFNPPSFTDTQIEVCAYLIVTEHMKALVDTGVGTGNAYVNEHFNPQHTDIGDALAALGYATTDIDVVINSHLHFDHCGNNQRFPHADNYVQEAELDVARNTRHTVREWFDYPQARILAVKGNTKINNEIELLSMPGHTPGHQAVLVHGPDGDALIAAQAAFNGDEFKRGGDPEIQAHEGLADAYTESIKKLSALGANAIYFSHDPATLHQSA